MSNTQKKRKSRLHRMTFADYIILFVVGVLCITMLYPFVNLIFQSISPDWVITEANGMVLYPKSITFENYVYVLNYPNTFNAYKNTIFITLFGTALALTVTSLGGYSLSKRDLPGRRWMTLFMILTMFIGGGHLPESVLRVSVKKLLFPGLDGGKAAQNQNPGMFVIKRRKRMGKHKTHLLYRQYSTGRSFRQCSSNA